MMMEIELMILFYLTKHFQKFNTIVRIPEDVPTLRTKMQAEELAKHTKA